MVVVVGRVGQHILINLELYIHVDEHHKTLWSQGLDTHIKAEDEHADVVGVI